MLPGRLKHILYLDLDIVAINPIRELYDTSLDGYLFAAAMRTDVIGITEPLTSCGSENINRRATITSAYCFSICCSSARRLF